MLRRAEAHGKHLFHHYGPDLVVHVHLGLYGKFSDVALPVDRAARAGAHAAWSARRTTADLRGPTACELITDAEAAASAPGSAPTRCAATPTRIAPGRAISRSRAPLATLLMDQ